MPTARPMGFACFQRGFQVTFGNGVTISTMFGAGNYCDNYGSRLYQVADFNKCESSDTEFAAWREDGKWCTRELCELVDIPCSDEVVGYISVAQWLQLVAAASVL